MAKKNIYILACAILFISLTFQNTKVKYIYNKPDKTMTLPEILNEISGISVIDSKLIACIQDENGIIFIYNTFENKIEKQIIFGDDGDYEGIAKVDKNLYVLRSDGVIFEIIDFLSDNFKVYKHINNIPASNNEGLCYDSENNRLLLACKSKTGKGKENKNLRSIYSFNLNTKKLSNNPIFIFDVNNINTFYSQQNKKEIDKNLIKLRTSAICIDPISNKLFLLSASDYKLFIFNKNGQIENIENLDRTLFNKAEGITFYKNGDLLISNEAQTKRASILLFKNQIK